jgi:hypothetical protein
MNRPDDALDDLLAAVKPIREWLERVIRTDEQHRSSPERTRLAYEWLSVLKDTKSYLADLRNDPRFAKLYPHGKWEKLSLSETERVAALRESLRDFL